jgi:ABC-type transport system involved in multi-copper enzyme maturation permease subunit
MKPHYRDQIILGLIIAAIIALWRLVVWLIT